MCRLKLRFSDSSFRPFFLKFQLCLNGLIILLITVSCHQSFFTVMQFSFPFLIFHLRIHCVNYFSMNLQLTGVLWCPNLFLYLCLIAFAWELQFSRFWSPEQISIDLWKPGLCFLLCNLAEATEFLFISAIEGTPVLNISKDQPNSDNLPQVFCSFPKALKSFAAFLHFNCEDHPFFACNFLFIKDTG